MKIFWAVLVLLVLAAGTYLVAVPKKSGSDLVNAKPAEIALPINYGKANTEAAFFEGDASAKSPTPPVTQPEPPKPAPVEPKADEAPKAIEPVAPAPEPIPAPEPAEEKPAPVVPPTPAPADGLPTSTTPLKPAVENQGVAKPANPEPAKDAAAQSDSDVTIVRNDDGTMLIDGKYTVSGEGTKEKPYEITWEYLVSAEESYQPRLGKKKLPGRLTMLHDKYVKITGYVAFPIMATEATEMLSMLNQWDGCCIGVPPTPYDAIEVKLAKPAEGEERLASYAAVTGIMKVDPYLVKDWLVSLYMMEEGEVTKK